MAKLPQKVMDLPTIDEYVEREASVLLGERVARVELSLGDMDRLMASGWDELLNHPDMPGDLEPLCRMTNLYCATISVMFRSSEFPILREGDMPPRLSPAYRRRSEGFGGWEPVETGRLPWV